MFIDHKGKRKAKCIGDNKRAAQQVAEKIQAKIALGQFEIKDEQKQRPFDMYFRNWMDTHVKAHCKERTYELYHIKFQRHLFPRFGQKDIAEIRREEVRKLAYDLLAQGLSRSTVKMTVTPLSAMFNFAVEDGHVAVNPAVRILRRRRAEDGEQRKKVAFLTREEAALLLDTCQEQFPTHYPLVLLLARTGMRIGEALALQWGDLNLQSRFAEVQRTFSNGRISTPKSGKNRRVDLSLHLTETLKTLRRGWGEVPPWVFVSQDCPPWQRSHFAGRVWPKLFAKVGLRQIRIHDLRHTFASLLIQQGESLAYVKEQMGHHSIQITVDTYGHLVPGGNKAAVDRLDELEQATLRNRTEGHCFRRIGK